MTDQERAVVEQALEALEIGYEVAKAEADRYHTAMAGFRPESHAKIDAEVQQIAQSITALRAALAQPEPEPAAWRCSCGANLYIDENGAPRSKASTQTVQAELERLRADNAALRREAHAWWTAARDALQLREPLAPEVIEADRKLAEIEANKGEPVAWMLTDPQNPRLRYLEWDQQARPYRGEWIRTPLVVGLADAPPERKHYALADLLKDMQPGDMPRADEWDAAPPIGQEEGPKR